LGKLIGSKGFEKLPKVTLLAQLIFFVSARQATENQLKFESFLDVANHEQKKLH